MYLFSRADELSHYDQLFLAFQIFDNVGIYQGWGQILEKGFKSKSKSFEFFQIQIKSKSFLFQKDLNPNRNPF